MRRGTIHKPQAYTRVLSYALLSCSHMQLRAWRNVTAPLPVSMVNLTWASKLWAEAVPWFKTSAWPRLILVGFHIAELSERTIPPAVLVSGLGYWAFLVPLVMLPGMFVRFVAREKGLMSGGRGVLSKIKMALDVSLVRIKLSYNTNTPITTWKPYVGKSLSSPRLSCYLIKPQRRGLLVRTVALLLVC